MRSIYARTPIFIPHARGKKLSFKETAQAQTKY